MRRITRRYTEGVRARQILTKCKENDVCKLRRANAEEYVDVFGDRNSSLVAPDVTAPNPPKLRKLRDRQRKKTSETPDPISCAPVPASGVDIEEASGAASCAPMPASGVDIEKASGAANCAPMPASGVDIEEASGAASCALTPASGGDIEEASGAASCAPMPASGVDIEKASGAANCAPMPASGVDIEEASGAASCALTPASGGDIEEASGAASCAPMPASGVDIEKASGAANCAPMPASGVDIEEASGAASCALTPASGGDIEEASGAASCAPMPASGVDIEKASGAANCAPMPASGVDIEEASGAASCALTPASGGDIEEASGAASCAPMPASGVDIEKASGAANCAPMPASGVDIEEASGAASCALTPASGGDIEEASGAASCAPMPASGVDIEKASGAANCAPMPASGVDIEVASGAASCALTPASGGDIEEASGAASCAPMPASGVDIEKASGAANCAPMPASGVDIEEASGAVSYSPMPASGVEMNKTFVRSLSLTDLTEDKPNTGFYSLKKAKSVSHVNEDCYFTCSSSWLDFHRILDQTEEEYQLLHGSVNDLTNCESEEFGDLREGRKRRHVADPTSWKRNQAKLRRMRGDDFLGFSRPAGRKIQQDTLRPARVIGEACTSEFCRKSKIRGCNQFTEETRKRIHEVFWKTMNWDQRKVYVLSLVTRSDTARKTKTGNSDSRREGTFTYDLPIKQDGSEKLRVCKKMFLNTLSLGSFAVQSWVKKADFGMTPDQNIRNILRAKPDIQSNKSKILGLHTFLNNLPKLPSHYARKESNKLFIEPIYHSLADLFKAYKIHSNENEQSPLSRYTFEREFNAKNLSLYTLKKDMCDVCSKYKAGNLDEVDYQIHLIKKERARKEKDYDKERARAGEIILLTMDLEAVKLCPYLTASALYFKTKLACHNFTVFNLITKHCTCYWFDETAADLTASTFATFIIDYLEKHCISQNKIPIVLYSDGCTYQNRNAIVANALLHFSKEHNITVIQKYLEPGHTQMECDSVHSAIERKLKNREIHLPSDYITVTREARKSQPYNTVDVDYMFIKDHTRTENSYYGSIRPGRKAGDPQVVDIRAIKYNTMTIEVKLDHDADWIALPRRPKLINTPVTFPQLHQNRLPISERKYNDLQQLKQVLPRDCHAFYDALPYR